MELEWIHRCLVLAAAIVFHASCVGALSDSACYGTDPSCNYYNLTCVTGQRIRLQKLQVGRKDNTACPISVCTNATTCCSHDKSDASDVLEPFNLQNTYDTYSNCSARQSCETIQAPWQQMTGGQTSSYVVLEYGCVQAPASTILNICGTDSSPVISSAAGGVDIMFDGSKVTSGFTTPPDNTCECRIKNTGSTNAAKTTIDIIDARLQKYQVNVNTSQLIACSSATMKFPDGELACSSQTVDSSLNFTYNSGRALSLGPGHSVLITLQNLMKASSEDFPTMVWLRLSDSANINVTCGRDLPPEPTTTTTTAATTTTTTVVTTTTTTPDPTTTTTSTVTSDATTPVQTSKTTPADQNTALPSKGDKDGLSDDELLLVIFLPLLFVLLILGVIIACCCWRRTRRNSHPSKKFHYLKQRPGAYDDFRSSQFLDNYIVRLTQSDDEGVVNPAATISPEDLRRTKSVERTVGSSVKEVNPHQHANGGVSVAIAEEPIYAKPIKANKPKTAPETVVVKAQSNGVANPVVAYEAAPNGPVVMTPPVQTEIPSTGKGRQSVYRVRLQMMEDESPQQPVSNVISKPQAQDRKVTVVRAGNVPSNDNAQVRAAPVSAAPTAASNARRRSTWVQLGYADPSQRQPNTYTGVPSNQPIVRQSGPAVIIPDTIQDKRASATAHVLPGSNKDGATVVFVK